MTLHVGQARLGEYRFVTQGGGLQMLLSILGAAGAMRQRRFLYGNDLVTLKTLSDTKGCGISFVHRCR